MATLDVTSASAALKVYYSNQRMQQLTYKDCPFYAMLTKIKNFEGSSYPLPMRVTNPQGRSATFSNAQAQKQPSNYKTFQLVRKTDYSLASITTEAILASSSNPGAFIRLATAEIDGALESLKRSIAFSLYGDGSGSLGTVTEPADTETFFDLENAEDVVKFEVGQLVEIRNGATVRLWDVGITDAQVTSVDRDSGRIGTNRTYSAANGTIADGDTVNVVGDYDSKLTGLAGWIPSTAPTGGDNFFGVDRSIDATRLGGVRVTSTGKPLDEALIDAARRINREGGSPDYAMMSFDKYAQLEKTLGGRIRYEEVQVAGISFTSIVVNGPSGKIRCMADRDCPSDRIYLLTMDSWALYSLKEPIMLVDLDGNKMLREASADAYEVRCAFYGQLGCNHPGSNAVMVF